MTYVCGVYTPDNLQWTGDNPPNPTSITSKIFRKSEGIIASIDTDDGADWDSWIDTDNDGLSDYDETNIYFTNPSNPDTDCDGLWDGYDITFCGNPHLGEMTGHNGFPATNPNFADTDSDGLWDGYDITICGNSYLGEMTSHNGYPVTNPTLSDSDGDGLYDGFNDVNHNYIWDGIEVHKGEIGDFQGHGGIGTNPMNPDTDSDGLDDKIEHDGWNIIIKGTSRFVQTNPCVNDTDYDGIIDSDEKYYGLDPTTPYTLDTISDQEWLGTLRFAGYSFLKTSYYNPAINTPENVNILKFEQSFGDDTGDVCVWENSIRIGFPIWTSFPDGRDYTGKPVTLHLGFTGGSSSNFYFKDIAYGYLDIDGNLVTLTTTYDGHDINWKIDNPSYLTQGMWYFQFTIHYEKASGEVPHRAWGYIIQDEGQSDETYGRIQQFECPPISPPIITYTTYLWSFYFTTTGDPAYPAYLRGETVSQHAAYDSRIENVRVLDYYDSPIRIIGKKAFERSDFQYPLGILPTYTGSGMGAIEYMNKVEVDWFFGQPGWVVIHLGLTETGELWGDSKVVYKANYHTKDYDCWDAGLSVKTPVIRIGTEFRVVISSTELSSLTPTIEITDPLGNLVTSAFHPVVESYCPYFAYTGSSDTYRDNILISAPTSARVGKYTIHIYTTGSFDTSLYFYLIFDPYSSGISSDDLKGYAYAEDIDGLLIDGDCDKIKTDEYTSAWSVRPAYSTNAFRKYSTDSSVYSVLDLAIYSAWGQDNEFDAMGKLYRLVNQRIQYSMTSTNNNFVAEDVLGKNKNCGVKPLTTTVARSISDNYQTIPSDMIIQGECMDYAEVLTALARAIGIPARPVNGLSCYGWSFHVWTEVWISSSLLPKQTGTTTASGSTNSDSDNWYVFDSTDNFGEPTLKASMYHSEESIDPRVDYYESQLNMFHAPIPNVYTLINSWDHTHAAVNSDFTDILGYYSSLRDFWHSVIGGSGTQLRGILGWGDKDFFRISLGSGYNYDITLVTSPPVELSCELYIGFTDYPQYWYPNADYTYNLGGSTVIGGVPPGDYYFMIASDSSRADEFGNVISYKININ